MSLTVPFLSPICKVKTKFSGRDYHHSEKAQLSQQARNTWKER